MERERQARQDDKVPHTLRKERCIYAVISIFFALSYVGRFVLNEYEYCTETNREGFADYSIIIVFLFEGVSMGVLMAFHWINFKTGSLFSSNDDKEPSYASIMKEEYHFFSDAEVDAHSLADESSQPSKSSNLADS